MSKGPSKLVPRVVHREARLQELLRVILDRLGGVRNEEKELWEVDLDWVVEYNELVSELRL